MDHIQSNCTQESGQKGDRVPVTSPSSPGNLGDRVPVTKEAGEGAVH